MKKVSKRDYAFFARVELCGFYLKRMGETCKIEGPAENWEAVFRKIMSELEMLRRNYTTKDTPRGRARV